LNNDLDQNTPKVIDKIFLSASEERQVLPNVDLQAMRAQELVFNYYSLRQKFIQWPENPVKKLTFVDIIFLDPVDLSAIPFVEQLSFHLIDETPLDILQQSKLPAVVDKLIFGKDSLNMITHLLPDIFPAYIHYLFLDQPSFMIMNWEAQQCLLMNLCKLLLTQSTENVKSCAQHLKEIYFDAIQQQQYYVLEPMKFARLMQKNLSLENI